MKENGSRKKKPMIPKVVNVLGDRIKIVDITPETIEEFSVPRDLAEGSHGLCAPGQSVIFVRSTNPQSKQKSTLLHELCHMIIAQTGVQPKIKNEEAFVTMFSQSLWAVLDSNEDLRNYLLKGNNDDID